ncbi:methionyl-tRNA formyltransferase [Maritalea mediterranea]|uniref:Methionyl-tRNA formyltransferase n=1 Tax=Maritalea mediterranea TaxID=2909667 RepID=A0ABS9E3P3_9HYPH|nr:methionyl-tRNA formyltransferase [Maritalea mediterranea]MCF4097493.1 methionyl-tRNA formyltransferase [Maritalea mediterranea]
MRVIFMGTPEIAVPTLSEIIGRGHDVVAVYTQPPRPAGRGKKDRKSPVHELAEGFGIEVRTPLNFKDPADVEAFEALDADVAVVVAYGLLLPKAILDAPAKGCLNLHASLLPRWRGAAPIQRAIMAGDKQTGMMVMQMDEGLDTGDVGLIDEIPISSNMTAGELHDEMMVRGADMMGRALSALERDSLDFTPQASEGVTYAKKIDKKEARIDWTQPAEMVHNQIRGLSPFPGAWFEIEINDKPVRIKIIKSSLTEGQGTPGTVLDDDMRIACGEGAILPLTVQREGKGAMDVKTFLRGPGSLKGKVAR